MSRAIAAHHGAFGRACMYVLDRPMAMHAHREGHLIFLVSGSRPRMTVAGNDVQAGRYVAAAVSPLQPHDFGVPASGEPVVTLVLYINPAWFAETGKSADCALRFGRADVPLTPALANDVQHVATMLSRGDAASELDPALRALTVACHKASWHECPSRSPIAPEGSHARDNRIRVSIRLMTERLGDEDAINIDDIASDAGLSRPHFYRLFREHVGITPNVYLNTLRAEKAIERLVSTDQDVTSIGLDLGFSSQASFTRFFRSNVGIPPTEYRRAAHLG